MAERQPALLSPQPPERGIGRPREARPVPPTAQSQASIEADVAAVASGHAALDDDRLRHLAEHAIRNHDPCISRARHFLKLVDERR